MSELLHGLHQNTALRLLAWWSELHEVVMNLQYVALSWCVRFAGQIMSSLPSYVRINASLTREAFLQRGGESSVNGSHLEDKFLNGSSWASEMGPRSAILAQAILDQGHLHPRRCEFGVPPAVVVDPMGKTTAGEKGKQ